MGYYNSIRFYIKKHPIENEIEISINQLSKSSHNFMMEVIVGKNPNFGP